MPYPGCRCAAENRNAREPKPMPALLPADMVDGHHHHQIGETSDFALTAVKAVMAMRGKFDSRDLRGSARVNCA